MKRVIEPHPVSRTGLVTAAVRASCLWLAGCAGPFGFSDAGGATAPFSDPGLSMQTAMETITIGKSSQQDVIAALGRGTVIKFDIGYEVYVYRRNPLKSEAANAEVVILFAPSGIVKKPRIRPADGVSTSISN